MAEFRRVRNRFTGGPCRRALSALAAPLVCLSILAAAPAVAEISPPLLRTLDRLEAGDATRQTARQLAGTSPRVRIRDDGTLQLSLTLAPGTPQALDVSSALAAVEATVQVLDADRGRAQVLAPFDRIRAIDALPFVLRTDTPGYAFTRAISQGDALHGADTARNRGGVDGSGIRIGILSDGAGGLAEAQASGDLPAGVRVIGSCTPMPFDGPACQFEANCAEGTALAEIIHDLAPGAELAIAAVSTADEFVARIGELVDDFDADIIIDDLGFYFQPIFEPSQASLAVQAATQHVLYVSAAGNAAAGHHEAQFLPVTEAGQQRHDFGAAADERSEAALPISIAARGLALVALQWNDPFGASANDYNLAARVSGGEALLCEDNCESTEPQDATGDPMEGLCYYNDTDQEVSARLTVEQVAGDARRVELFVLGDAVPTRYAIPAGSIIGHNGVAEVISVGAVWESSPDTHQRYSAQGPVRMDFPVRSEISKPDLVAADGVAVSGAGGFPTAFFGTSAAAPHVAAAAALLMQQFPDATDSDIRRALTERAVDLGTVGFDLKTGAGRLDIPNAVRFFTTPEIGRLLPFVLQMLLED